MSTYRIASYQFEEDPPSKVGEYEVYGYDVIIKVHGEHVYFSCDNQIGKLSVPDMQLQF